MTDLNKKYRICDADVHISYEADKPNATRGERIIELMDESGVEYDVITLLCGTEMDEPCDYEGLNKYVYDMSKKYPNRFIPMGWINPRYWGPEDCKRFAHIQCEEYGFKATKMNPYENYYDLFDPVRSLPVIEEIAKLGMIMAFHTTDDERSHPHRLGKIAAMYPETPFLAIHMGQTPSGMDACIEEAKKNSNMYLVGSSIMDYSYLRKAVDELGSKRVCFGTDSPMKNQRVCMEKYLEQFDGLSDDEISDVLGGNTRRLFGVE